ncbi:MAG: hypothetical protein WCP28_02170 [Actinomycetes bacterium]
MSRTGRLALITVAATVGLFASWLLAAPPVMADAGWSSTGGHWQGTGALIVPGGQVVGEADAGGTASGCSGCSWHVTDCADSTVVCGGPPGCPEADILQVWFSAGLGVSFRLEQVSCAVAGQAAMSLEQMGTLVKAQVQALAPELNPTYQPRSGPLTQLPTLFDSGQPRSLERVDNIAGYPVRLRATPRWTWLWGDGGRTETADPGGEWPDESVAHTYRNEGVVRVVVQCVWSAQFWIGAAGPYRVSGDGVEQSAARRLTVRQARAALVPMLGL